MPRPVAKAKRLGFGSTREAASGPSTAGYPDRIMLWGRNRQPCLLLFDLRIIFRQMYSERSTVDQRSHHGYSRAAKCRSDQSSARPRGEVDMRKALMILLAGTAAVPGAARSQTRP